MVFRIKKPYAVAMAAGLLFTTFGVANVHAENSIRQATDVFQFGTGEPRRSAAVLTRERDRLSLSVSALDLFPNSAYTVWWVVFNQPQNCLEPNACNPTGDVFESPGVLSSTQIPITENSASRATGFVTGDDGVANFTAELIGGMLPTGTFVQHGWSEPVAPGPDDNAGLLSGNGLRAEVHALLRSHGPAVAGSVAEQISTFNGLCDVQECTNVQGMIFQPPEPAMSAVCIDTDGDGYGWDGSATCLVEATNSAGTAPCVDTDGDGWGWDGTQSCRL